MTFYRPDDLLAAQAKAPKDAVKYTNCRHLSCICIIDHNPLVISEIISDQKFIRISQVICYCEVKDVKVNMQVVPYMTRVVR